MAVSKFNRGSAKMFDTPWMERFTHVHPLTPAVLFLPVIGLALYGSLAVDKAGLGTTAAMLFVGYLSWTLTEYWLHRLVFHLPIKGPISEKVYFFIHGVHHDWPWDTSRLVMPPVVSISLGLLAYWAFTALVGAPYANALFAGYALGYLIYDTVHWYTHAMTPKKGYLKFLRKQHMVHHFKSPDTRFGVSCPWWDYVFRTHKDRPSKSVPEGVEDQDSGRHVDGEVQPSDRKRAA